VGNNIRCVAGGKERWERAFTTVAEDLAGGPRCLLCLTGRFSDLAPNLYRLWNTPYTLHAAPPFYTWSESNALEDLADHHPGKPRFMTEGAAMPIKRSTSIAMSGPTCLTLHEILHQNGPHCNRAARADLGIQQRYRNREECFSLQGAMRRSTVV